MILLFQVQMALLMHLCGLFSKKNHVCVLGYLYICIRLHAFQYVFVSPLVRLNALRLSECTDTFTHHDKLSIHSHIYCCRGCGMEHHLKNKNN